MSAPGEHEAAAGSPAGEDFEPDEEEIVDGVPVIDAQGPRTVLAAQAARDAAARLAVPGAAVQAAAAAAGGFLAGAAVLGIVQRHQRRAAALARAQRPGRVLARRGTQGGSGGLGELVQIVGSRSLLVDVHLLAGPSSQGSP